MGMLDAPVREPAVAGRFYPGDATTLREQVERSLGPIATPPEPALVLVGPHAGYVYSGAIAGETWARVAVPRRFTQMTREIWSLQGRLARLTPKRANRLLEHPRFRAAYDFLALRAEAGEPLAELVDWWTRFQDADEAARAEMLAGLKPDRANKPRRRRRRRKKPAE